MSYSKYEMKVLQWGMDRGIVQHGKPIGQAIKTLEEVTELLDAINRGDMPEIKDALCDIEVTANGVAYLAEMDKPGADRAVLDSNDAKLVDGKPVILEGGKIGKPAGWTAPDLRGFV